MYIVLLKAIKCVWEALNFELIWTITLNLYWVNYLLTTTNTITGGGHLDSSVIQTSSGGEGPIALWIIDYISI